MDDVVISKVKQLAFAEHRISEFQTRELTLLRVISLCPLTDAVFFFSSRRRHTRFDCDWSSDVCSSDLLASGPSNHKFAWTFSNLSFSEAVKNAALALTDYIQTSSQSEPVFGHRSVTETDRKSVV